MELVAVREIDGRAIGGGAYPLTKGEIAMVLTPGPNMIYLVSRSLSQGSVAGLVSLDGHHDR